MPYVDSQVLDQLIKGREKSGIAIISFAFSEKLRGPALFDKKYFDELIAFKSSEGSKKSDFEDF